jgi:hypothetical protein
MKKITNDIKKISKHVYVESFKKTIKIIIDINYVKPDNTMKILDDIKEICFTYNQKNNENIITMVHDNISVCDLLFTQK